MLNVRESKHVLGHRRGHHTVAEVDHHRGATLGVIAFDRDLIQSLYDELVRAQTRLKARELQRALRILAEALKKEPNRDA